MKASYNRDSNDNFHLKSPLYRSKDETCAIYHKRGAYRFHDFRTDQPNQWWAMAQVYGAWLTGKGTPLANFRRVEFAVHQTRLLFHLGLRTPPDFAWSDLPPHATETAKRAWEGFRTTLQCHRLFYGSKHPAPYTYSHCALWTGMEYRDAHAGVAWLRRNSWLVVGRTLEPNASDMEADNKANTNTEANVRRPTNLYLPTFKGTVAAVVAYQQELDSLNWDRVWEYGSLEAGKPFPLCAK
jgi:hypothetical protein